MGEEDYRQHLIRLNGTKREFVLDEKRDLFITQGDVRQVQLAKGAILSGFTALLKKAGIGMEDLDKVLIAGQFGAHLPAEFLTGVGILPEEVENRLVYVGNSSKTGGVHDPHVRKDESKDGSAGVRYRIYGAGGNGEL